MLYYKIPNDIIQKVETINFVLYQNEHPNLKNKVFFTQNVMSLLISGEKEIFYSETPIKLNDKIALIGASHCLMSEKKTEKDKPYQALLIFFDNGFIDNFKLKYSHLIKPNNQLTQNEIITIPKDPFILLFRDNLVSLLQNKAPIVSMPEFKKIKLEELFLYLLQHYPKQFSTFLSANVNNTETLLKAVVENNKYTNLTIDELAFLCHMSSSTFKRHFKKYYNESPKKWLLKQRLLYADFLLKTGKKPSQIYAEIGYKNTSNFIRAYKNYFGMKPKK